MSLIALPLVLFLSTADVTKDRLALTEGVRSIVAPGALPGPVLAEGTKTFVVLVGGEKADRKPIAAAGTIGSGRAFVLGHGGFLSAPNLKNPDNARLLQNSLSWLGGRQRNLRVGVWGLPGVEAATETPFVLDARNFLSVLPSLDVVCIGDSALDDHPNLQDALMKWVKSGHGLLVLGLGWGWQQLHPGKDLGSENAANRMLLPYGLGFADGFARGNYSPDGADSPLLQSKPALEALTKGGLTPDETGLATDTIHRALTLLPDGSELISKVKTMASKESVADAPSVRHPLTQASPFSRLLMSIQSLEWQKNPPSKVKAHPSAAAFPGAVPASARRISRSVEVDTSIPQRHGLGLYAAPGEVVTLHVPAAATKAGLEVRIGAHTDQLWELDKWSRFPAISRAWPIREERIQVASPFGGLIYLDVPNACKLGAIQVRVENAVPAIRYVRGKTSMDEWRSMVSDSPAPWAEIEGKYVILTVPRSSAIQAKDPEALMAFWDEMMERVYELYAAPVRRAPERYCTDVQISAGYMHSGYPIMTWLDVADTFCNLDKLRGKGSTWGFYHEMGHNFQQSEWTFDGTGEVTNNLFSLYGAEKLNGITPATYGLAHKAAGVEARREALRKYLANGARFDEWKQEPFLALAMYIQLREGFGWEPFTRVFAEYRSLSPKDRPRGDLAKHDQWMVRFSRQVGRDLGPFFQAWGIPTSEAARRSIANLPAWMPKDWPAASR